MGVVGGGLYAQSLEPFIGRFGSQLLVLLHDDVVADPVDVFDRAAAHVGASGGHVPEHLGDVLYSNQARQDSGERRAPAAAPLSDADRRALFEYFRDDVKRLEDLLDRDLDLWRPN
jgi:hypothetical protein